MERENTANEIVQRTHRMPRSLHDRIIAEANKSGNAISNEMNSLILDGLRFREATVVIHVQEK